MLSTLVCIALFAVLVYFAFLCLYEGFRWISNRLADFRLQRRNGDRQRMLTPA